MLTNAHATHDFAESLACEMTTAAENEAYFDVIMRVRPNVTSRRNELCLRRLNHQRQLEAVAMKRSSSDEKGVCDEKMTTVFS